MAVMVVRVDEKLYLKNPEETPLGRKIVAQSVVLIDELGFEKFTVKKLAQRIQSTEASIYRYFESKHHLMNYLSAWYWGWVDMRIQLATMNVSEARHRLRLALEAMAASVENDPDVPHIDESILHRIVVSDSGRAQAAYKQVDSAHYLAVTKAFEAVCDRLTGLIRDVRPDFRYPRALTLTLVSTTHRQHFYATHRPDATDVKVDNRDTADLATFLDLLASSVLTIPESEEFISPS